MSGDRHLGPPRLAATATVLKEVRLCMNSGRYQLFAARDVFAVFRDYCGWVLADASADASLQQVLLGALLGSVPPPSRSSFRHGQIVRGLGGTPQRTTIPGSFVRRRRVGSVRTSGPPWTEPGWELARWAKSWRQQLRRMSRG